MNREKLLANPAYPTVGGAAVTNTPITLTVTAPTNPGLDSTIFLAGFQISASAAPTLSVRATITGPAAAAGSTALATIGIQIPAAAFAMIARDYVTHPIACVPGQNLVMILPALGAGIIAEAALFSFTGSP